MTVSLQLQISEPFINDSEKLGWAVNVELLKIQFAACLQQDYRPAAEYRIAAPVTNSAIITKIEQLMENRLCPVYEMEKCWDGLHFLLTGVSASQPIEDDPLSEAIVGVHVLDTEDFIAAIGSDELPRIPFGDMLNFFELLENQKILVHIHGVEYRKISNFSSTF